MTDKDETTGIVVPEWTPNLADANTAIALFIHENEPAGPDARLFRKQFLAALVEAYNMNTEPKVKVHVGTIGEWPAAPNQEVRRVDWQTHWAQLPPGTKLYKFD